jgi:hypothetical protein
MSDQEKHNQQHSDSQPPSSEQKTQPQVVPTGQPKSPQPEQEKQDQANKKHA